MNNQITEVLDEIRDLRIKLKITLFTAALKLLKTFKYL